MIAGAIGIHHSHFDIRTVICLFSWCGNHHLLKPSCYQELDCVEWLTFWTTISVKCTWRRPTSFVLLLAFHCSIPSLSHHNQQQHFRINPKSLVNLFISNVLQTDVFIFHVQPYYHLTRWKFMYSRHIYVPNK